MQDRLTLCLTNQTCGFRLADMRSPHIAEKPAYQTLWHAYQHVNREYWKDTTINYRADHHALSILLDCLDAVALEAYQQKPFSLESK